MRRWFGIDGYIDFYEGWLRVGRRWIGVWRGKPYILPVFQGGGPAVTVQNDKYAFGDDDNNEATHTLDSENTNRTAQAPDVTFMIRIQVEETNNGNEVQPYALFAQKNGAGGFTEVTTARTDGLIIANDTQGRSDDENTSERLSYGGSGSFANGKYDDGQTEQGTTTVTLKQNYTDFEFAIQIDSANASGGDYWELRVEFSTGTDLDSYPGSYPTVTADIPLTVSESDSIAVGESVDASILLEVSESESITIGESVNVSVITGAPPDLDASASDSISVGETIDVDVQIDIAESDSVVVGDTASAHVQAPWYNPETLVINTGSIESGSLEDTWTDDGNRLVLNETAGTPGFSYDFYFYDVPATAADVAINGYYDGIIGHFKKIRQYNFTTTNWTDLSPDTDDFPPEASDQTYIFRLLNDSDYNSSGEIRLRLIHTNGGNAIHNFYIDQFLLGTDPAIHINENISVGESGVDTDVLTEVSVSDSITVGESDSIYIQQYISASDSITITDTLPTRYYDGIEIVESVDISIVTPGAGFDISESDSIAVGESVDVDVLIEIIESDSIAVGESVSVDISIEIYGSDSVAVGENTDVDIQKDITESDSIAIGESVDIDVLIDVTESDTIAVGESVNVVLAVAGEINLSASDSIAVGESVDLQVSDPQIIESDAIAVGESVNISIAVAGEINLSASDSIAVGESVDVNVQIDVAASDSIAVGDTPKITLVPLVTETDNVAVGDTPKVTLASLVDESDTITVGENVSLYIELDVNESDTIAVGESVNIVLVVAGEINLNTSDSITVGESVDLQVSDPQVAESDSIAVGESVNISLVAAGGIAVTESDNITVSDSPEIEILLEVVETDNISVSDSAKIALASQVIESDSVAVGESIALAVSDPQVVALDAIAVGESVNISIGAAADLNLSASDNINIGEIIDTNLLLFIQANDTIGVSDSANAQVSDPQVIVSDAISVGESPNVVIYVQVGRDIYFKGMYKGLFKGQR